MGYESKIVVIDRKAHENWVFGDEIATFDLSKMGYSYHNGKQFRDLFTIPIDFDLYINESAKEEPEEFYREDRYGAHCNYTTDIDNVIAWLEEFQKHDSYRRARLFLNFLKVLKESAEDFSKICLVHYGY